MIEEKTNSRVSNSIQSWIVTLSVLFFSLSGTVLSLICIYTLPDKSVKPLEGSLFFFGGTIAIISLLIFRWKKDFIVTPAKQVIFKENISDKIIKWVTAFFTVLYVFMGFAIALICIYALPDQIPQPKIGAIYFLGSALVIASFVFVVWRNWDKKKL